MGTERSKEKPEGRDDQFLEGSKGRGGMRASIVCRNTLKIMVEDFLEINHVISYTKLNKYK